MKSIWKGSVSFGLVSIPIEFYTAQESEALGFHLLHDTCHTRLLYHRWCPHCKKDVSWDDTVKGIKKADGSYLVLTQSMIKELRVEKTDKIDIVEFVDKDKIPIIYLNHHYYVAPQEKKSTSFALFVKALEALDKVAIGRFVMRDKEYTCALQVQDDYLVLTTLYYAYEVRNVEALALAKKVKVKPAELKLAKEIVKKLSVKEFDITEFKDTFAQEIKKLLKQKTKKRRGKKTKVAREILKKPTLTSSLRASLKNIKQPVAYAKKRR